MYNPRKEINELLQAAKNIAESNNIDLEINSTSLKELFDQEVVEQCLRRAAQELDQAAKYLKEHDVYFDFSIEREYYMGPYHIAWRQSMFC